MTDPNPTPSATDKLFPARDRLFALIASIPGSGTVDWCGPARALLDEYAQEVAAPSTGQPPADARRDDLLRAIDFNFTTGVLGYGTPEELLAAYDASRTAVTAEQLHAAIEQAVYEYREQACQWQETDGTTQEITRRAVAAALRVLGKPSAGPSADRAALRQRIAAALVRYDWNAGLSGRDTPSEHHFGEADAVLAVLPEPTGQTAARAAFREAAAVLDRRATGIDAFASSDYGEEARAVRELADAANELRRLADEQPTTPGQTAESCVHCGMPIQHVTGTLAAWWVHLPGGNTICDPARAAASTRATPPPAGPAAPAKEAPTVPCSAATFNRPHPAHDWEPQPGMTPVRCPGTRKPPMDPVHILGIDADDAPAKEA